MAIVIPALVILLLLPFFWEYFRDWLVSQFGFNKFSARQDFYTTWIALFGVAGVALTLWFTQRRINLQQKQVLNEHLAHAITQLGNASEGIRISGIYSLYNLAKDYKRKHLDNVCEIFCAHIRMAKDRENYHQLTDYNRELIGYKMDQKSENKPENRVQKRETPSTELQLIIDLLFKNRYGKKPIFKNCLKDLSNTYLGGVDFSEVTIKDTNFRGATIKDTIFSGATITETSFRRAIITKTKFSKAKITKTNFRYATITETNFRYATITETSFRSATITKTKFSNATIKEKTDFRSATITETDFRSATITETDFRSATITETKFSGATIKEKTDFSDVMITKTEFQSAIIKEKTDFYNATITGIGFRSAKITETNFRHAKITETNFRHATITETDFSSAKITEDCNFKSYKIGDKTYWVKIDDETMKTMSEDIREWVKEQQKEVVEIN